MTNIKLPREAYQNALSRAHVSVDEKEKLEALIGNGARTVNVTLKVDELPDTFLAALLNESALNSNQRAVVSMRVHGIKGDRREFERIYDTSVAGRVEFASVFAALGTQGPNCEYFLNGRWYPISLGADCHEDESKLYCSVHLSGQIAIGDTHESVYYPISQHIFSGENGSPIEKTVRQVLHDVGLRPLTITTVDYNLKLLNAERRSRDVGQQVWIAGPVLIQNSYSWWNRTESRSLGTKESPRKGVIEAELETCEGERGYYGVRADQRISRLPFVRVFSLDTKRYVYVDIDDLQDYQYDTSAIDRLHLPEHMLKILTTVFVAPTNLIFGDLIAGKHGGMVILASGNPGVGKTLTAEVYSELTLRPLYVLELGELGTTAAQVEENLNRVFTRVARWDAVLQFDECEIFLAKRGDDLERSAIVGIFLRLLDYYRGILFLTTNRPEVLDLAVLSRVTLRLEYPDLSLEARTAVWKTMLHVARLSLTGEIENLARLSLNGRQVRNVVRLARIVHSGEAVSVDDLLHLARIAIPDLD